MKARRRTDAVRIQTIPSSNVGNVDNSNWLTAYPEIYERESRRIRRERTESRKGARERRRKETGQRTFEQEAQRTAAIARHHSRLAAIDARWQIGHHWPGGAVGRNPSYYRAEETYRGLVSDEHSLLKLFVQYTPKAGRGPNTLRTGKHKAESGWGDSKLLALDEAYVDANARMRGVLRVDLDSTFPSFFAVREACRRLKLKEPHIIVGHVDRRGHVLKPHVIWLLADPTAFCGRGRNMFRALWHQVLRGLTFALLDVGADPGGLSNPMRMKNPLCPVWSRDIADCGPIWLKDLAQCVRQDVTDDELVKPRADDADQIPDIVIDPEAASDVLFTTLRKYGREITMKGLVPPDEMLSKLTVIALAVCALRGLPNEQGIRTAENVTKYFHDRALKARQRLSPEEVKHRRAQSGRDTAADRKSKTVAVLVNAYLTLVRKGRCPTQVAVAKAAGRAERTAQNWWPLVLKGVKEAQARASAARVRSVDVQSGTEHAGRSFYFKKGAEASGEAVCKARSISKPMMNSWEVESDLAATVVNPPSVPPAAIRFGTVIFSCRPTLPRPPTPEFLRRSFRRRPSEEAEAGFSPTEHSADRSRMPSLEESGCLQKNGANRRQCGDPTTGRRSPEPTTGKYEPLGALAGADGHLRSAAAGDKGISPDQSFVCSGRHCNVFGRHWVVNRRAPGTRDAW